jgi:hypothetical protein
MVRQTTITEALNPFKHHITYIGPKDAVTNCSNLGKGRKDTPCKSGEYPGYVKGKCSLSTYRGVIHIICNQKLFRVLIKGKGKKGW